jgi:hypothetical protein
MDEKESAYQDDPLADLQAQFGGLRESLFVISQALNELRGVTRAAGEPARPHTKYYKPFYFPEGRVERVPCGRIVVNLDIPQQGTYYLLVNNSGDSDCNVDFEESTGLFAFRSVGPGESRGATFFADGGTKLVARCRGDGQCSFTYQLLFIRP